MRTTLGLLATVIAIAACDDQQQPTSPPTETSSPRAAVTVASASPVAKAPDARPADQVGFTKVQYFETGLISVNAGANGDYTLNCPAGTFVISGGHNLWGGVSPLVRLSRADGNGWHVLISNDAAGATFMTFRVSVNCIS